MAHSSQRTSTVWQYIVLEYTGQGIASNRPAQGKVFRVNRVVHLLLHRYVVVLLVAGGGLRAAPD